MRVAYLDEAGISNPLHEPIMTVAGVVVHGDKQFKAVEIYLEALAQEYVPNRRSNFCFHAYEIFGGVKSFDRKLWPLEKRLEILDRLANIPKKFDLPVIHCSMDRSAVKATTGGTSSNHLLEQVTHAHAFFFCTVQIEILLRATTPDEVAILVAEDRDQVRKMLRFMHDVFRGKPDDRIKNFIPDFSEMIAPFDKFIPFERVVDRIHFSQKKESSLLQIADVCAFAVKRKIMGAPHCDRLYKPIAEQFVSGATKVGFGPKVHNTTLEA